MEKNVTLDMYVVDSFTDVPFCGNPAAVCCLPSRNLLSDELMEKLAAEMNLSETAFVSCKNSTENFSDANCFDLRWFTPTMEVDLCGHATIATAAVIFKDLHNKNEKLEFSTKSGVLYVVYDGKRKNLKMQLPCNKGIEEDIKLHSELLLAVLAKDMKVNCVYYSIKTGKLLVDVDTNMDKLSNLKVNRDVLLRLADKKVSGLILTIDGKNTCYDFVSRYFAPWKGIDEDPVTGSAHTVLTPYWSRKLNKSEMKARQASPRGGDLLVGIDENECLVTIEGKARIVVVAKMNI